MIKVFYDLNVLWLPFLQRVAQWGGRGGAAVSVHHLLAGLGQLVGNIGCIQRGYWSGFLPLWNIERTRDTQKQWTKGSGLWACGSEGWIHSAWLHCFPNSWGQQLTLQLLCFISFFFFFFFFFKKSAMMVVLIYCACAISVFNAVFQFRFSFKPMLFTSAASQVHISFHWSSISLRVTMLALAVCGTSDPN